MSLKVRRGNMGNWIWIASSTSCKWGDLQSKLCNDHPRHRMSQPSVTKQIKHCISFFFFFIFAVGQPTPLWIFMFTCAHKQHARGRTHAQILDPMQTCHKYQASSLHKEVATLLLIVLQMGDFYKQRLNKSEHSCGNGRKWNKSLCQEETRPWAVSEQEKLLTASVAKKTAKPEQWRCTFWVVLLDIIQF